MSKKVRHIKCSKCGDTSKNESGDFMNRLSFLEDANDLDIKFLKQLTGYNKLYLGWRCIYCNCELCYSCAHQTTNKQHLNKNNSCICWRCSIKELENVEDS